jgi:hypothetical protein
VSWIQTFTDRQFWPLEPRIEDIDIRDIAHSLSLQCRFNGHCKRFYSVAEHSVLVATAVSVPNRLAALLHDAAETYLTDLPRPVKHAVVGYDEAEKRVEKAIAEKFGFEHPLPAEVKEADCRICLDERDQIMGPLPAPWGEPFCSLKPLGVRLRCWSPEQAENAFLAAFDFLGGKR